jgi:gliding motility-associated-like protein
LDIDVEIFQLPVVASMEAREVCLNDSVRIEASSATAVSYEWSPSDFVTDTASAITYAKPLETTDFKVAVTDENGCVSIATQRVRVNALPFADAGEDIEDCDISSVYLGGITTALPGDEVTWSPSEFLDDPYALNPLAITAERTMFYLEVQNDQGCFSYDSVQVNSDCYSIIYAPTAFTPGNNDINDEFKLTYYRIVDPKLTIFDRWGEIVFETNDLTIGWDGVLQFSGTEAQTGVYYWTLSYKSDELQKLFKDGTVTLLR